MKRPKEGREALVSDSGQPKSVTLGEVSKERDLERGAAADGEENICNAL